MIKTIFITLVLFYSSVTSIIFAQNYFVTGSVIDSDTKEPLSYANIRIDNSGHGTASNDEGQFKFRLPKENYTFIASFIGYKSDTINIDLTEDLEINFSLSSVDISLSEITVKPGENPAYEIIKKTILAKDRIKSNIIDYQYSAYTKGLVKTTRDFQAGGFSLSTQDTGKLKITGILENESRGFYKAPDNYKHFIVARKQTANTPPFINVLTGGNVTQSFYEDNLFFLDKNIPSPISERALSYYYFYIEKEIAIDNQKVFQIYFANDNTADPGFFGKLFIADSTYYLLKADVRLNAMANPGGLFNYVRVFQQFSEINDEIVLPIDYRIFADGNYLGLAKFGFELHTIMNNYDINTSLKDDIFEGAIISVLPEADKKDKSYWNSIQTIPNTLAETIAYSRIDSLTEVSKTFGEKFSLLAQQIKMNDNFSINGPLQLYSLNKVEGNALNFELFYSDAEVKRLDTRLGVSYGFADKKLKTKLLATYLLGDYRTTKISLHLFDKLTDLFGSSNNYNKFTSTVLSLISKYDFRDYYYSKGFEAKISTEVFPFLNIGLGYLQRNDKSAINNSDFSLFNTDKNYFPNQNIYDTKINALTATFGLDFRNYIEDGFFRRRITSQNNIQFEGSLLINPKDILKNLKDFSIYELSTFGNFRTLNNWSADFYISKIISNGAVPFQMLHALSGNISTGGKNNSYRTLRIGEVFGDDVTSIFINHRFKDDLFRFSQIPILKDLQLQFSTHLNIALSRISEESKQIIVSDYVEFKSPFYELGFSIGHILFPLNFEFTWKLNYRGKNNFVFGINTFAL